MMKITKLIVSSIAAMILFNGNAIANSSNIETTVTGVGVHGSGRLAILVDDVIDEPGCPNARVDIDVSHPNYKHLLSVALSAQVSGNPVSIKTAGCYAGQPTFTNGIDSWITIMRK